MALTQFLVLYLANPQLDAMTVEGFLCQAEDGDHADEQCRDAYPDCEVLWVHLPRPKLDHSGPIPIPPRSFDDMMSDALAERSMHYYDNLLYTEGY